MLRGGQLLGELLRARRGVRRAGRTPYGKFTAEKWATCSGSGNGGCGAWAVAIAGPDGVADSGCTGDGGCERGGAGLGFIQAEIDASGLGIFVDEQGNPIAIEDVDRDHSAIRVLPGENGQVVIEIKPRGTDQIERHTCQAPCTWTHSGMTGGNDRGQNNPNGDYHANSPVPGKPGSEHEARGTEGVGIAQDAQGNAEAWVRGRGEAIDGRTGDRIVFTRQALRPSPGSTTSGSATRPARRSPPRAMRLPSGGRRTASTCGSTATGAKIQAPTTTAARRGSSSTAAGSRPTRIGDIVDIVHADNLPGGVTDIIGRGANGSPGIYSVKGTTGWIQFNDPNYNAINNPNFSETPGTGIYRIKITGGDLSKGIKVTTPDKNGMGGSLWCEGNCVRTMPGVASDGSNGHMYDPVTQCNNCRITEQLPTGTGRFPWGYGSVELFDTSNGLVSRYTPWGDKQTCAAGSGGRCGFTQYNRSLADAEGKGAGQGVGAICSASGEGGGCYGMNAEGDFQNATVLKDEETGQWVPVRMGLMYRVHGEYARYGDNAGRFCVGADGACSGNAGSPLMDAPPESNAAMAAVLDPSLRISEDMARQLSELKGPNGKPLLEGRKPDDRSPLTAEELERLEGAGKQDVLDAYGRDLPLSQAQRDGVQMSWLDDAVTERRLGPKYEALRPQIDDLATRTENALADDNYIDDGEWADIKPLRDAIDREAPGMLERWLPAQSRMQMMRGAGCDVGELPGGQRRGGQRPGTHRAPARRAVRRERSGTGGPAATRRD